MTAQVAILNTHGIAVASDSAVTVTDGRHSRSYPSADKIFPVVGVPLAVLHSGNAALFGVPWQLLIEMWARSRDAAEAESMEAYADEFQSWLVARKSVVTERAQQDFLRWTFRDYMLAVRRQIRTDLEDETDVERDQRVDGELAEQIDAILDSFIGILDSRDDFLGMEDIDGSALVAAISDELQQDLDWVFNDTIRSGALDKRAMEIAAKLVRKAEPFGTDAVLAFVGYARDAYFPSLYRMTVSGVLGDVARIYETSKVEVSASVPVSITPLGMTDAIHAFLRGTGPQYRNAAHLLLEDFVLDEHGNPDGEANARAHRELDSKFDELEWNHFLEPMLDIAESLPLVETLRLADSLVGLASLRQLIQGDSSVGGPIDLARITRSGGFNWVRSKSHGHVDQFVR